MKTLRKLMFACFFLSTGISISIAQKTNKRAAKAAIIQQAVDSQTFVFHAQQAIPLSGGTRQLTSDYFLRATPDSVLTDLPYFGRAYSVPYPQTDGGINVNLNKFTYEKTNNKKGGWDIVIKPTERMDVQELILFISSEGYATLKIISINRQEISFNGYVSKT